MTMVNAYRITSIDCRAVSDWLEGFKYNKTIKIGEGIPVYGIDMDFIDAKVGDWVVVWPSGARITYSAKGFAKHFTQINGSEYETPWTPLFNAMHYSRPIIN